MAKITRGSLKKWCLKLIGGVLNNAVGAEDDLIQLCREALAGSLAVVGARIALPSPDLDVPTLIAVHPEAGLIAFDAVTSYDVTDPAPFRSLNRRIQTLKEWLDLGPEVHVHRFLVDLSSEAADPVVGVAKRTVLSISAASKPDSFGDLAPAPLGSAEASVVAALFPEFTFRSATRSGARDVGKEEREAARLVLDAAQIQAAQTDIGELGVITGPPGSGKTLVLASRARWLAQRHPRWDIRILCYNRALMPYLMELVADLPTVQVQRMAEFAKEMQLPFHFTADRLTRDGLAKALRLGHRPVLDAVLIDEAQDFKEVWLDLVRACVMPERGGVLLAGDEAQGLYHDGDGLQLTNIPEAVHIRLAKPYRSTRRIMRAIGDLDPEFAVEASDEAPDGEPVELIWAESWDKQAECVGWEISSMLASGERSPKDIGVLVTTKYGTFKRLSAVFDRRKIPFTIVDRENADVFDRSDDSVKIMTVHAAKGHEFPVAFVFALETLPDIDPDDSATRRRGRVGFVGGTRAKDQLLITYTRDNKFLDLLSRDDDDVRRWVWPDSYEGDMNG